MINYFKQAAELKNNECGKKIVTAFKLKMGDSDNSFIVTCAAEILESFGISKDKFKALRVGPDKQGEEWELWLQLIAPISELKEEQRYVFFSIPTNGGRHSIAAVIDRDTNQIFYIDSKKTLGAAEAKYQLMKVRNNLFANYTIVPPPTNCALQQRDNVSCGIHSTANIVGLILNQEKSKPNTENMIEPINLTRNVGIKQRTSEEVDFLILVCCLANEQFTKKMSEEKSQPRINCRQKKAIKFALQDVLKVLTEDQGNPFRFESVDSRRPDQDRELVLQANQAATELRNHNVGNNLYVKGFALLNAVLKETPTTTREDLNEQSGPGRPLEAFINDFKKDNPENLFLSWLQDPQTIDCLPKSEDDNTEYKEKELFLNFVKYIKDLYVVEHKDEEEAKVEVISNHPRSDYSKKDDDNFVVNNPNNGEEIEEKEEKHEEEEHAQTDNEYLGELYRISKTLCQDMLNTINNSPAFNPFANNARRYGRFDFGSTSNGFFEKLNLEIESLKERLEAKDEETLIAADLEYVSAADLEYVPDDQNEVINDKLQYKNKNYDKGSSPETIYEMLRKFFIIFLDHPKRYGNVIGKDEELQKSFEDLTKLVVEGVFQFRKIVRDYKFNHDISKEDVSEEDVSEEEQKQKVQLN